MDTVIEMIHRAVGPMIVTGAIALALILQNSVSRSNAAVQNLLEDTYALSATESSRSVDEILYTPDDIKSILYNTDDVSVSIEVRNYSLMKHYKFQRTLSSFTIFTSTTVSGDIDYESIYTDSNMDTVPDKQISEAFKEIVWGSYTATYEYSEVNGRTNIIFTYKGA